MCCIDRLNPPSVTGRSPALSPYRGLASPLLRGERICLICAARRDDPSAEDVQGRSLSGKCNTLQFMPWTSYHCGPALVAKAVLQRTISLPGFAATQLASDVDPLNPMFADIGPLHGPFHSLPGVPPVPLVAGVIADRYAGPDSSGLSPHAKALRPTRPWSR